ncbi:3-dehydroquinate synthase [Chitinispirillum alkaliphilum]|nr:3-dehydroquinate synthase [Chitinispirillum alkaliphilum]
MEKISVGLEERSYPIFLGSDIGSELCSYLKEKYPRRKSVLVTNDTIARIHAEKISGLREQLQFSVHEIPDGERYKTVQTWSGVLDKLIEKQLDRKCFVIALGGGVVGDIAGFAAACFMRGIDYVQVPTTLLAMVDSSVGGKTAVDHRRGKNLIGAFHQPKSVWVDLSFLDTLPKREYIGGCAELFKYGFLGGEDLFSFVRKNKTELINAQKDILFEGIKRSIETKARIVGEDEKESGVRALLNFGHTFAHAFEQFYGFEGLIHGEALIWGMICACDLGLRKKTMSESAVEEYRGVLSGLPLPRLPGQPKPQSLYGAMSSDKKVTEGKINFVLPFEPGRSAVVSDVTEAQVLKTLQSVLINNSSPFLY